MLVDLSSAAPVPTAHGRVLFVMAYRATGCWLIKEFAWLSHMLLTRDS